MRYLLLHFLLLGSGLVAFGASGYVSGDVVRFWQGTQQIEGVITQDTGERYIILTDDGLYWKDYHAVVKISSIGISSSQQEVLLNSINNKLQGISSQNLGVLTELQSYNNNLTGDSGTFNETNATLWNYGSETVDQFEPALQQLHDYLVNDENQTDAYNALFPNGSPWNVLDVLPVRDNLGQVLIYQASLLEDANETLASMLVKEGNTTVNVDVIFDDNLSVYYNGPQTLGFDGPESISFDGPNTLGYSGPLTLGYSGPSSLTLDGTNLTLDSTNLTATIDSSSTITVETGTTPLQVEMASSTGGDLPVTLMNSSVEVTSTNIESSLSYLQSQVSSLESLLTEQKSYLETLSQNTSPSNPDGFLSPMSEGWGQTTVGGGETSANLATAISDVVEGIKQGTAEANATKGIIDLFYERNHEDLQMINAALQGFEQNVTNELGDLVLNVNMGRILVEDLNGTVDANETSPNDRRMIGLAKAIKSVLDQKEKEAIEAVEELQTVVDEKTEDLEEGAEDLKAALNSTLFQGLETNEDGVGEWLINVRRADGSMDQFDLFNIGESIPAFDIIPSLEIVAEWIKAIIGLLCLWFFFKYSREHCYKLVEMYTIMPESAPMTNYGGSSGGIVNGPLKVAHIAVAVTGALTIIGAVVLFFESPVLEGNDVHQAFNIIKGTVLLGGGGMGFLAWKFFCAFFPVITATTLLSFYITFRAGTTIMLWSLKQTLAFKS